MPRGLGIRESFVIVITESNSVWQRQQLDSGQPFKAC